MKIFLLDLDEEMTRSWQARFNDIEEVEVVNSEFCSFMKEHINDIAAVVSAANSFGLMDGGLDGAYIRFFGKELQDAVQSKLIEEYLGEQPVGSSMIVDIPGFPGKKLIHTPTMRIPQPILDPRIVYICTRSALVTAYKNNDGTVLLPAFGHLTGRLSSEIVSSLMEKAYRDVIGRISDSSANSWEDVHGKHFGGLDDDLIAFFRECRI